MKPEGKSGGDAGTTGACRPPGKGKQTAAWVIGGGKFGLKSAETLRRLNPAAAITMVDQDPDVCRRLNRLGFTTVRGDGVAFLVEGLAGTLLPDWIIPVIPLHVAYHWLRAALAPGLRVRAIPVPAGILPALPHPMPGTGGEVFMSLADFVCPENCPEPGNICTHTGKARPYRLYEKLAGLRSGNFCAVVIRSRQLAPGLGGFRPAALFDARRAAVAARGPVLLSTACSCHGVMHAFVIEPSAAAPETGRRSGDSQAVP